MSVISRINGGDHDISPTPRFRRRKAVRTQTKDRNRHRFSRHCHKNLNKARWSPSDPVAATNTGLSALRPGQRVIFSKGSGNEISVDGQKVLVMKESEILAVVQRSLFEAWRNWGATARPLAATALVTAISVAAAYALEIVR